MTAGGKRFALVCSDSSGEMGAALIHSVDGGPCVDAFRAGGAFNASAGKTGAVREFCPGVRRGRTLRWRLLGGGGSGRNES